MASNKVQVTLGFNADTTQALQAILKLNKELNNIQSIKLTNLGINQELNAAADAAKTLLTALLAAFNLNTGLIDMSRFAQLLKLAGTDVSTLSANLARAGLAGTVAFTQVAQAVSLMDVPIKQTNKTLQTMLTTLKNTAKWEMSSAAIHGLESAFSNAIGYVKDLNEALTDIRVVSGLSVSLMAAFAEQANISAKALGTTTKEYAKAALTYYQQGDSAEMAAKKAEITLKATNVAFKATAQEMSEMLTSTWNGFLAGADELEHYVDVMANLGSHTASSVEEIATALLKVAATARTVGVSMEQMSAMIATVSSATRLSAEVVGTSMNTILSRFSSLKLGETLEDGLDLTKYTKALAAIGVNVLDINGELREMGSVVDDIMDKWQTLSDGQKVALAQTVGGVRQYTNMMALFNNLTKYLENMQYAQNADGALQQMEDIYLSGIEGKSKQLKASLEGIWQDIIDDQAIIKGTEALTKLVDGIHNMINSLGGLGGIAASVGGILVSVFSKNIAASLTNATLKVLLFKQSISSQEFKDNGIIGKLGMLTKQSMNQRLYNQLNQAFIDELATIRSGNQNSVGLNLQLQATQILLEKKLQLVLVESSLSDVERAGAQAQLAALLEEANLLTAIGLQYDQNTQLVQRLALDLLAAGDAALTYTERITNIKTRTENVKKEYYSGVEDIATGANIEVNSLGGLFTTELNLTNVDVDLMIERAKILGTAFETVSAAAGQLSSINIGDTFEQALPHILATIVSLEGLREHFKALGTQDGDEAANKILDIVEKLKNISSDNFATTFLSVFSELQDLMASTGGSADLLFTVLEHAGVPKAAIDALRNSIGEMSDSIISSALAGSAFEQMANKIALKASLMQTKFEEVSKGVGIAVSGLSAMYNMTANWDTSNFVSKAMQISMVFKSLGSNILNIAAGIVNHNPIKIITGIIGTAALAVAFIKGLLDKHQKQLEETAKNARSLADKTSSETLQTIKNNLDLINTYNELYNKYKETGEVTDDLIDSAKNLADVYGVQDASVKLLKGDIDGFNTSLSKSLDLSKELLQARINFQDSRSAFTATYKAVNDRKNITLTNDTELLQAQSNDLTLRAGKDENFIPALNKVISPEYGKQLFETWFANYIKSVTFDEHYNEMLLTPEEITDIYQNIKDFFHFDDNQMNLFKEIYPSLKELRDIVYSTNFYSSNNNFNDLYANMYEQFQKATTQDFIKMTNSTGLTDIIDAYNNGAFGNIEYTEIEQELLNNAPNFSEIYTQLYQKALDAEKKLTDLHSGPLALAEAVMDYVEAYANVQEEMAKLDETSLAYKILEKLAEQIGSIATNEDLIKTAKLYVESSAIYGKLEVFDQYKTKINGKSLATIGTDEVVGGFLGLSDLWTEMAQTVTNHRDQFDSLKDLTPNTEKYNLAVDEIVAEILKEWGAIDDSIDLFKYLKDNFKENDLNLIISFMSSKGITDLSGISKYLSTIKYLLNLNLSLEDNKILEDIANISSTQTEYDETIKKALQMQTNESKLKKNMTMDELSVLYDTYWDGSIADIIAWEDFIALDYDAREAYIKSITKDYVEASKTAAENLITALNTYKDDYINTFKSRHSVVYDQTTGQLDSGFEQEYLQYLRAKQFIETTEDGYVVDHKTYKTEQEAFKAAGFDTNYLERFKDYEILLSQLSLADANIEEAQKWVSLLLGLGDAAETALSKVNKLLSAISSFPTTKTELNEVLKLINDSNDFGGGEKMTATDLVNIYKNNPSEYRSIVLRTLENQYAAMADGDEDKLLVGMKLEQMRRDVRKVNIGEEIAGDQADLTKYTQQITNLQSAYQEFLQTGKLSKKTLSALEKLGIDPNSVRSLDDLSAKIKQAKINLESTRDSLKKSLTGKLGAGKTTFINDDLTTAQMTWEEFKAAEGIAADDNSLQAVFENWKQSYWNARQALDGWDEAALKANDVISKSIKASEAEITKLTDKMNELKTAVDGVNSAFQNNTELTMEQRAQLTTAQLKQWDEGGESRLELAARMNGEYAMARYAANRAQRLNAVSEHTRITSSNYGNLMLFRYQTITDLSDEILAKEMNRFGIKGQLAKAIQEEVKSAQAAGETLTWDQIFTRLSEKDVKLDSEIASIWAEFKQAGVAAVEAVLHEYQSKAQEIVDIWTIAFQSMAKAQEAFAKGLNLTEALYQDEQALASLSQLLYTVLKDADKVRKVLRGESVDGQTVEQWINQAYASMHIATNAEYALSQSGATEWLYAHNAQGGIDAGSKMATSSAQMLENATNYANSFWQTWLSQQSAEMQAKIGNKQEDVVDAMLRSWFGEDYSTNIENIFNNAVSQILGHEVSIRGQREANAQSLYETQLANSQAIKDNTQLQIITERRLAAVEKALGLLRSNKALDRSTLTPLEIEDIEAATGKAISAVGIDDLDVAAAKCASSLVALLNAALLLSKTLAQNNGFEEGADGQWRYRERLTTNEYEALESDEDKARYLAVMGEDGKTITGYEAKDEFMIVNRELTESFQLAARDLDETMTNATTLMDETLNTYSSELGLSVSEFKEYAASLHEIEGNASECEASLYQLAAANLRASKAFDNLQSNAASWKKTLTTTAKTSDSYRGAMTSMRTTLANLYNVEKKFVSADFVEEHLKDIEKVAKGSKEAANQLGKALADDILGQNKNISFNIDVNGDGAISELDTISGMFQNLIDNYSDTPIGVTIDSAGAIAGLNEIVQAGGETAESVMAALNAIGWTPEVEMYEAPLSDFADGNGNVNVPIVKFINGLPTVSYESKPIDASMDMTSMVQVPKIGKGGAPVIKGLTKTGAGSGSSHKSSGGGGGGGSKKKDKKDDTDKERYHQINRSIAKQNSLMDKNEKLKSRKYGADYEEALIKENKEIEKQIALNKQKYTEAERYAEHDRAELESYGATFDAEGNLNYEAFMDKWNAWYNQKADDFANGLIDEDKWKEEVEDVYEKVMKALENYEEAEDIKLELINDTLDKENQILANNFENITYKVNLKLELNDNDLQRLNFMLKMTEEYYDRQGDAFALYGDQIRNGFKDLEAYNTGLDELNAKHTAGLISDKDYGELSLKYSNDIWSKLSEVEDMMRNLRAQYGVALEKANEELEKHTLIMTHAADVGSSYITILGLMGHKLPYSKLKDFYDMQYQANLSNLSIQRLQLDHYESELKYYEDKIAAGQTLSETEQKQYEDLQAIYIETHNSFLSNAQKTLEGLKTMYDESINEIWDNLSKVNAAGHNNINDMAEAYGYWQEQQKQYLATGQQLYEVSKLNRDIEGSIADATTKASKLRLAALQQVINAKSEEGKLTEYNIEMYELQYKMALAMLELEDARNAKSTVRLVRDASGNYGYQYTADADKLDEAEQNYEEVLEQIRKLTAEYADQMAEGLINARTQLEEELRNLKREDFASDEEYMQKRRELIEFYTAQMKYYADQYAEVTKDLATNLKSIGNHYKLSQEELMNATKEIYNEDVLSLIDGQKEYETKLKESLDEADSKWDWYTEEIKTVESTTKLSYENMTKSVKDYNAAVEAAEKAGEKVIETSKAVTELIHKETAALEAEAEAWLKVIDKSVEYAEKAHKDAEEQANGEETKDGTGNNGNQTGLGNDKFEATWVQEGDKWKYQIGENEYAKGWKQIGDKWYHFDDKGFMEVGWFQDKEDGNKWYYLGPDGAMVTGNYDINGVTHEFASNGEWIREITSGSGNTSGSTSGSNGYRVDYTVTGYDNRGFTVTRTGHGKGSTEAEAKSAAQSLANDKAGDLASPSITYKDPVAYLRGGLIDFTGPAWVDGTQQDPELVLNASDTPNLLAAVLIVRTLSPFILSQLASNAAGMLYSDLYTPGVGSTAQQLEQIVQITAEFPNAVDHNEIEAAFNDLINQTAQYINRK